MRSSSWNYSQFRLLSISIAFIFDPSKLRPKRVASTFRLSSLDLKIAPFLSNRAISQTNKLFKTKPIEHQSSIPASSAKLFATFSLIYKKFLSNRPVCSISSFVFKLHCKSPFQAFFIANLQVSINPSSESQTPSVCSSVLKVVIIKMRIINVLL